MRSAMDPPADRGRCVGAIQKSLMPFGARQPRPVLLRNGIMSGTSALSSPPPIQRKAGKRQGHAVPRLANGEEAPVDSPVHALQQELIQIESAQDGPALSEPKAPGWVRLTLPLVVSGVLWLGIFQLVAMLW